MNNLKVMSTLADETRYHIYQYMLQHQKQFTVQDIADEFNIHPNVSRLHLTKLSEIGIVQAEYAKSGKGGRPGRVYHATKDGIVISFPKRDHDRLLKWSLEFISSVGDSAIESLKSISYQDGVNEMASLVGNIKHSLTFEEKINLLSKVSYQIGYVPTVIENDETKQVIFSIYNCPFTNQLEGNAQIVCSCHESYLKGHIDVLFPNSQFLQTDSMLNSCSNCQYKISIKVSQ
ncbi:MAG TPA: helix-turn-helix domain-containing protein [Ureibacillus sp.]|nr:helix-turn-helix domain-containing protein [Ureibacillus sp.]